MRPALYTWVCNTCGGIHKDGGTASDQTCGGNLHRIAHTDGCPIYGTSQTSTDCAAWCDVALAALDKGNGACLKGCRIARASQTWKVPGIYTMINLPVQIAPESELHRGVIPDSIEHMTPDAALAVLGFARTADGIERDGIIFLGAPPIPGADDLERLRWIVYWAWLSCNNYDTCSNIPVRTLSATAGQGTVASQATFFQYCLARGICACVHGDCTHADVDAICDYKGACGECDCVSYRPLDVLPLRAFAYLRSRSLSYTDEAAAKTQLHEAEQVRKHAAQLVKTAEMRARSEAIATTRQISDDAARQIREARRIMQETAKAKAQLDSDAKDLQRKIAAQAERERIEKQRAEARAEAIRTGNRFKTLDFEDSK